MKKYAIFFPQFHQVPVNDDAWGFGFTDWALVAAANAFGYWRRRAPACGFYDLANSEEVGRRFAEAANAGLDGFGIYHYRFDDGPELEAVERYLRSNSVPENFNCFFIWANESWTRRWAGRGTEILKTVSSSPSREQIRAHVKYLKPFLESGWYTKYKERPMFVIYRPEFFRDPSVTLANYRAEFNLVGLDPAIGFCLKSASDISYSMFFDFCYLFEPRLFFSLSGVRGNRIARKIFIRMLHRMPYSKVEVVSEFLARVLNRTSKSHAFAKVQAYYASIERGKLVSALKCPVQNVLTVGWNNAPRYRDRYVEVAIPSVDEFAGLVCSSIRDTGLSIDLPLLCNAWNEWSEGAALEPCKYLGDSLLLAYINSGDA